jgi:hypothetical protein
MFLLCKHTPSYRSFTVQLVVRPLAGVVGCHNQSMPNVHSYSFLRALMLRVHAL